MERGMNERVRNLRRVSTTTQPAIDIERARLVTQAYKKYEGKVSVPELRALAFYEYMKERSLYLGDGELIVGEKAGGPQKAPTFPELCCHTLQDMQVMNDREYISFSVSEETRRIHEEEIMPYWQGRSMRERILKEMDEEWKACYSAGLFTEFMEQRGPGHTVGGDVFYHKGFLDFKREIEEAIAALDFLNDPTALKRRDQLRGMAIACDAIMLYAKRYADYALQLSEEEIDPVRKEELREIARVCTRVPAHAPESFREALQMYWFVHLGVTTELNPWDAFSPGRLDQHLIPFYEKDVVTGAIDRDRAKELLECLWVKFNDQPAPPKVGITLRESSTYTDFANINTGGITPDGEDGVNEVSYLILDVMSEMRLLQPSSNVQISRKTPERFLMRACEVAREGWGQPAFYNTDAIIQELLAAGKSLEDARKGGTSGCVETGAFGNEAYILTGYMNLPKILEITLNNGLDPVSKEQLGPKTGDPRTFTDFEQLMDAFSAQLQHFIDIKVRGNNIIERLYAEEMPVPFLSVVVNDCIKKGKDYNAGGARYNTSYIQGVGIGTLTDSLSAVKYNVFDKKRFTRDELLQAMADNFENEPEIFSAVRDHTPLYGNDDAYADALMGRAFRMYRDCVTGRPNVRGGSYRVNMLPTTCHVYFGEVMGASPNGRLAGMPVSEGISPDKGADRNGPTAVIRSCASRDQLSTGGTLLNQKFTPAVLADEKGLSGLANLIRTYFGMDGHHIQFNVIDRQTLLDAQAHPEDYKDLIVRVAGYSDHFHNLSKALQDEIIARTEQTL